MKPNTMRQIRQWHLYIGLFLAPMFLLFAVSGAFQVFRLNEERGWGGTPPSWLVVIGSIHKNSSLPQAGEQRRAPPSGAGPDRPRPPRGEQHGPSPLPLKIFSVIMAIGFFALTILGILIALNSRATRRGSLIALAAGIIVPLVLLFL